MKTGPSETSRAIWVPGDHVSDCHTSSTQETAVLPTFQGRFPTVNIHELSKQMFSASAPCQDRCQHVVSINDTFYPAPVSPLRGCEFNFHVYLATFGTHHVLPWNPRGDPPTLPPFQLPAPNRSGLIRTQLLREALNRAPIISNGFCVFGRGVVQCGTLALVISVEGRRENELRGEVCSLKNGVCLFVMLFNFSLGATGSKQSGTKRNTCCLRLADGRCLSRWVYFWKFRLSRQLPLLTDETGTDNPGRLWPTSARTHLTADF